MAELRPYPLEALIRRVFRELEARGSIADLPAARFHSGSRDRDLSVRFHGHRAATPLGPAAGPQSQMAQNVLLSWLGGCRIHELKTVQVDDRLTIPRPCIDMQTVGFNVEWSQELRLEESLEEYVKGAMLVEMVAASGAVPLAPGTEHTVYDMSVGYDLAGIRSERVQAFLSGMLDATEVVERLRAQIPAEYAHLRDLDFPTRLSDTLTLSTFHGCPSDEIEAICEHLLRDVGVHTIVKLNPMLLGPEETRAILNGTLGYEDLHVPDSAFERDTRWEQMEGFVERLGRTAEEVGLGFGVKFTNTLIVENHRDFFPSTEKEMYLSGPPLHVLAMRLVARFRARFGDRYPISFSAGIDRRNFPDAVALGLVPVTVCSDLLKPGGYGRARGYLDELDARMQRVGARDVDELVVRAYGHGAAALDDLGLDGPTAAACRRALDEGTRLADACPPDVLERWVSATKLRNTPDYVERATGDPRYAHAKNTKVPRKIGSHLELFDCITCDKCVPVCPNDANFTFALPAMRVPIVKLRATAGGWEAREDGELAVEERHQIANLADFCNDCGNCDVFCPEDGGPYVVKPRFFRTREDWERHAGLDGFQMDPGEGATLHGRVQGREYRLQPAGERWRFAGAGFELLLREDEPASDPLGTAEGEVDLAWFHVLRWVRAGVYDAAGVNWLTALRGG